MDKTAPEVIYREDEDILIIRFGPPTPAETLELGDGALVRIDPDTNEVVAVEVLNWSERTEAQLRASEGRARRAREERRPTRPILPRGLAPA